MNRRLFAILFLPILFITGPVSPLFGLDPGKRITQYKVHRWDIEAGLPSNSIYAICQTPDGYLWIGTQDGLVRFDGIRFEVFDRRNTPALTSNVIRALYVDRHGRLWIGTDSGGLSCYYDRQFTNYPVSRCKSLLRISGIGEDRHGNIWVGSFANGLTCLKPGQESFTVYTTENGLPHNQVRFVSVDQNRDVWITTSDNIVKIESPGVFRRFPANQGPTLAKSLKTVSVYDAANDKLWLGTGNKGLFAAAPVRNSPARVKPFPHPTVTYAYRGAGAGMWFGTDGGGLVRCLPNRVEVLGKQNGMACGFVYSIFRDREGSLWAGTLDGGLHQLIDSTFTTFTRVEGLEHDYIECLAMTPDGNILAGTKNGLNLLAKDRVHSLLTPTRGLAHSSIQAVMHDGENGIWLGTIEGLHYFRHNKLTTFTKQNGLSDVRVRCISRDRSGNTWIGTANGLNRYNPASSKLNRSSRDSGDFTVFTTAQGLSGNHIVFIYPEPGGALWISSVNGLDRFENGTFTAYGGKIRLGSNTVRCMHLDSAGVLWLGTDYGLIRWKDSRAFHITLKHGLLQNIITAIVEDRSGYLWLAGRGGVSRVKKSRLNRVADGLAQSVRPESFNERDGLRSRWCTGQGCMTPDGRLWFPTSIGAAVIDPGRVDPDRPPPPVRIGKLVADGVTYSPKESLAFGPGIGRLDIYFTAPSFINPRKIQFRVMLEGYDTQWDLTGQQRNTSYTRLPPGEYTFRVMARSAGGKWGPGSAALPFTVKSHFYQTTFFYVAVALFFVAVILLTHWLRVRALRKHRKELSLEVAQRTHDLTERTHELENAHRDIREAKELIEGKNIQLEEQSAKLQELDKVKSRFFANISHEFRTPLTLIMGPLQQMAAHTGPEEKKKINLMIRNSQRLLSLINQLLDLSKIDSGKMFLEAEYHDIVLFLKGIVSSFEPLADQHELEIVFQPGPGEIFLYFDPEKCEKIVFNLLVNAVKFTPPGGRVTLSARVDERVEPGFAEISVRDTGPGISPEEIVNIFDRFYQAREESGRGRRGTGIGLALVKELVQLHSGKINVHSSRGPDSGTEFVVRLPLGNEHLAPGQMVEPGSGREPAELLPALSFVPPSRSFVPPSRPVEPKDGNEADKPGPPIILVVEDNADMRSFIAGSLDGLYRVREAEDGEQGVNMAKDIIPDLVISDVMMPHKDGFQLCKELKTDPAACHIPIILLTAKASQESIVQGLETGADDYVTKPFNSTILQARVKNLIELRAVLQKRIRNDMSLQPGEIEITTLDQTFLKELREKIEENMARAEFSVEELCAQLYMSQATLYRKVHALTGQSPKQFIQSYRLQRAAQLIKANVGNITEVSFAVGFASSSYFSKCFKEKFHQSPREFLGSR